VLICAAVCRGFWQRVEVVHDRSPDIPKAAVLGNHAWYTATDWGRKKSPRSRRRLGTGTADLLGKPMWLWQARLPELEFNCGQSSVQLGGEVWKNADFIKSGSGKEESTARIVAAANSAAYETVIFRS